jgi:methionyl-tRNA synthetase
VIAKGEDEVSQARLATILYTICESLRAISILYSPIMPKSMARLWDDIGAKESGVGSTFADVATWGQLKPGVKITKSESMFPRIEEPETI